MESVRKLGEVHEKTWEMSKVVRFMVNWPKCPEKDAHFGVPGIGFFEGQMKSLANVPWNPDWLVPIHGIHGTDIFT